MRTNVFYAAAIISVMASVPTAQAGPLGGIGGGIGGGLGGGFGGRLGGLSGGLNGSLDGSLRLQPGQSVDPVTGRVLDAPKKVRKAAAPAQVVVGDAAQAAHTVAVAAPVGVATVVSSQVQTAASLAPPAVAGAVGVGLGAIRQRQSEALIAGGIAVLSTPDAYVYMDREADVLRRELVGAGVNVVRQGDAIVLQLPSDVTFAFDKSEIRDRFFPVLTAVANTLNQYPATYVDVIGHTDAVGSVAYNQALSERRAATVADFIERRETLPARLYVAGRGKSEPIATNATVQGRAENRRVEILLHPYTAG
jgi:outer membrane protein OmpA-like peptidoglycan-associated protein